MLSITVNNWYQYIGSPDAGKLNSLGNLSVENPTVEQLNKAISAGQNVARGDAERPEPVFGEHIREAADAVRRILR
jgi:hypothetical protein